jgi:HEAT repeat protein
MRKSAATVCLALLLFGCGDNGFRSEASYDGYKTSDWVQLAEDEDVEWRRKAVVALGELGPSEADDSVPALAKACADPDPYVRLSALRSLEKLAPKARKAAPAVTRALNDKNKVIVKQALKTAKAIEMARPSPLNNN